MSHRLGYILGGDIEEEQGPRPIVGSVEPRPQQLQKGDEISNQSRAIYHIHFNRRWNDRERMEVLVKRRVGAIERMPGYRSD